MDVKPIINNLTAERDKLDVAIRSLEGLDSLPPRKQPVSANGSVVELPRKRRGPRHMSAKSRRQISNRMKQLWADRRRNAA